MISYKPLFKTMKAKGISQYNLINDHGISASLLDKFRHGKNVNVSTLADLCKILDCKIEDIVEIEKEA